MTTSLPKWLPPLLSVNPWSAGTFEKLYAVFTHDFKESQPVYDGHAVWFFSDVEDGKEAIFWHLTHRDDKTAGERMPDFRRCERLPWARPMLDNQGQPEVMAWDYREGDGTIKTYVWLKDYDYLVLMKKYPDGGRRLITAHYVDYSNKRRKLEKKYEKRIV